MNKGLRGAGVMLFWSGTPAMDGRAHGFAVCPRVPAGVSKGLENPTVERVSAMQAPLYYIATIAVFAVLAVLVMGLWNLMRKNRSSNLSQKLMRWRVGLQFAAILLIIGYLLVKA